MIVTHYGKRCGCTSLRFASLLIQTHYRSSNDSPPPARPQVCFRHNFITKIKLQLSLWSLSCIPAGQTWLASAGSQPSPKTSTLRHPTGIRAEQKTSAGNKEKDAVSLLPQSFPAAPSATLTAVFFYGRC